MICRDQDLLRWWIEDQLGCQFAPDARFLGRTDDDTLGIVGCIVYDEWTGLACTVHMAGVGPGWMGPEFAFLAVHYPFIHCGVRTLLARVTDKKSIDIEKRLGFKVDFIKEGVHPDGPLHYMSLDKADCRWLKRGLHGQKSSRTAAAA